MLYIPEIFGTFFALLSVILGAFGAHFLKKRIPEPAVQSFEVGVSYMMYHGLALLILPLFSLAKTEWIERFFILGTVLFSFSIFLLSLQTLFKRNLKVLGPVTPAGGFLLIVGWGLLLSKFLNFYIR
jgi:uncharacterized membrane protein YgdD (TMEM256/DUF423 family)